MEDIFEYCLKKIYVLMLAEYGHQGWWPLLKLSQSPLKKSWKDGYHPGDYSYPRDEFQTFEIWVGAVLTQNTSWTHAQKALENLDRLDLLLAEKLASVKPEHLSGAIRCSGYFNQKSRRLKRLAEFFLALRSQKPTRRELLKLKGIGQETADSILLYAHHRPYFVVDAYTIRIVNRVFGLDLKKYDDVADLFYQAYLSEGFENRVRIFNEYHALLVRHAKQFCSRSPRCPTCFLRFLCRHG